MSIHSADESQDSLIRLEQATLTLKSVSRYKGTTAPDPYSFQGAIFDVSSVRIMTLPINAVASISLQRSWPSGT